MILSCPECRTKYRLDEDKLSPEGTKVRCSRCKHVFLAHPPAPPAPAAPADSEPQPESAWPGESFESPQQSDAFGDVDFDAPAPAVAPPPVDEDLFGPDEDIFGPVEQASPSPQAPSDDGADALAEPAAPPLAEDFEAAGFPPAPDMTFGTAPDEDDDLFGPEEPKGAPESVAAAPFPADDDQDDDLFGPETPTATPQAFTAGLEAHVDDDEDLFAGLGGDAAPSASATGPGLASDLANDLANDQANGLAGDAPAADNRQMRFEDDEDLFGALDAMGDSPPSATAEQPAGSLAGSRFDDLLEDEDELLRSAEKADVPADAREADAMDQGAATRNDLLEDDALGAPTADLRAEADVEPEEKAAATARVDELPLPPEPARTGRTVLLALLFLLLLFGGGVAAIYFLELEPNLPAWVPEELRRHLRQSAQVATPAVREEQVRLINLENVRDYTLPNQKAGQLLVVEGKAVNNFPTAKERIKVEVVLFDAQGKPLARREVLCGNTLSLFQLQIMTKAEVEAALDAESGIKAANTNLQTGQHVPFMAVFFAPPPTVAEYEARVIQALDAK